MNSRLNAGAAILFNYLFILLNNIFRKDELIGYTHADKSAIRRIQEEQYQYPFVACLWHNELRINASVE